MRSFGFSFFFVVFFYLRFGHTRIKSLFWLYVGLEILAFPCNQFGAQEPGSNEEIVEFACTRFKAEYPIFDKV